MRQLNCRAWHAELPQCVHAGHFPAKEVLQWIAAFRLARSPSSPRRARFSRPARQQQCRRHDKRWALIQPAVSCAAGLPLSTLL
jgi:hypothetical protein